MTRRLAFAAFALPVLLLLAPAPVAAGAREDMFAAWQKFLALKSFRATLTAIEPTAMTSTIEFQAPDRFRMVSSKGPEVVIVGDSAYMTVAGTPMKLPLPIASLTAQYRDEAFLKKLQDGMVIEDLGLGVLDGEPVQKVRYVQDVVPPALPGAPAPAPTTGKPDQATTTAWISRRSGLIIRLQVSAVYAGTPSKTDIRYSGFNDPDINIQAPQ